MSAGDKVEVWVGISRYDGKPIWKPGRIVRKAFSGGTKFVVRLAEGHEVWVTKHSLRSVTP